MLFNLIAVLYAFFMTDDTKPQSLTKAATCTHQLSLSASHSFCLSLWMTLSYAAATQRHPPRVQVGMLQQRQMGMTNHVTQLTHIPHAPVEGYWRHGTDAVRSPWQCHLTFCLAVSVGRGCSCCYGPDCWQLSLWQGESNKMSGKSSQTATKPAAHNNGRLKMVFACVWVRVGAGACWGDERGFICEYRH